MKHIQRRHGFVLVMALALIALVGLLLCAAARLSLRRSLEAIDAEEDLQRRWGSISAQRLLMDHVDMFFPNPVPESESAEGVPESIPRVETPLLLSVQLRQMRFRILLADEDAKVNLNTVHQEFSPAFVQTVVSTLSGRGSHANLLVSLRPGRIRPNDADARAFETWEQIFDLANAKDLSRAAMSLPEVSRDFTCWGSGMLNIHRASPMAVRSLCGAIISNADVEQLLTAARHLPHAKLADILNRILIRERARRRLERLLTDRSTCFSIWINMVSEKGCWNEFHVVATTGPNGLNSGSGDRLALNSIADFSW
jgi:hypothetical protein